MTILVQNIVVILGRMTEFWNRLHSVNLEYAFISIGLRRDSRMTRILEGILEIWRRLPIFPRVTSHSRFTENPLSPYGRGSRLTVRLPHPGRRIFVFTLTGECL